MGLIKTPPTAVAELIQHREAKTKLFLMPNGSMRASCRTANVHYESVKGAKDWQEIDLQLTDKDGFVKAESTPYKLDILKDTVGYNLSDRGGGSITVRLSAINGIPIKNLTLNITPIHSKEKLTWSEVVPGLDFEARITYQGVNLDKIVKTDQAPHTWTWDIIESEVHDFSIPASRLAFDNHLRLPLTGQRKQTDKRPRRFAEVTIDQSVPLERPDKSVRYTITETITGRTKMITPSRKAVWTTDKPMYPIWVDVEFNLGVEVDDGRTKNPADWLYAEADSTYGAWCGISGGTSNSYPCWRFPNVTIPNGATVTSAAVTVNTRTGGDVVGGGGTTADIHVDDSDRDAPAWSNTSNTKEDFTNTGTKATVTFNASATEHVIVITNAIASVVGKGTWTSGWALRLGVTSVIESTGSHYAYLDDQINDSPDAAHLDIDFDPPASGIFVPIIAYHQMMRHVMQGG